MFKKAAAPTNRASGRSCPIAALNGLQVDHAWSSFFQRNRVSARRAVKVLTCGIGANLIKIMDVTGHKLLEM
jgi:hypothetical protein